LKEYQTKQNTDVRKMKNMRFLQNGRSMI